MTRWFLPALLATGCSLAMSRPDPQRPHDKAPICDTGKGTVVLDAVMASVLGTAALGLVASSSSDAQSAALVPAIFGAIYLGSSVHGNAVANECRKAMDDFAGLPAPAPRLPVADAEPAVKRIVKPKPAPVPAPPPIPEVGSRQPEAAEIAPWSDFWKELP